MQDKDEMRIYSAGDIAKILESENLITIQQRLCCFLRTLPDRWEDLHGSTLFPTGSN